MVFFTCNHCGESLKKPAVEKHYQWKSCKGAPPFLTCVDCLKDFRGDEFKAHTKCITEDEKYSAKGFVAKPERNKGAQKQEAWTEIIQNHLLQRADLDTHTRQTLERLAGQTNVPRKKPKFINFVKSSMRISPNSAEKIWTVIETALAEFKVKEDAVKAEAAAKRKADEDARVAAKEASAAAAQENGEPPAKKSKKDKKKKKSSDDTEAADEEVVVAEKKSKKSKKEKQINEITSTTTDEAVPLLLNGDNKVNGADETVGKKKKNKKRKADQMNGSDGADDGQQQPDTGFEWKKIITEQLQAKASMKLEKLKSKVLKKLAAVNGGVSSEKDAIKFGKHLKKLSKFVEVDGETVRLIS